jgi:hypothetical protein
LAKVFKVVREHMVDGITSCCGVSAQLEPHVVNYAVGEWSAPRIPESKLFAFLEESDAWHFIFNRLVMTEFAAVYEAEAEGAKMAAGYIPCASDHIADFWAGRFQDNDSNSMTIPSGTVWCDRIKLVRRLPDPRGGIL